MKKLIMATLVIGVSLSAVDQGAELVEQKCTPCHLFSSSSAKLTDGKMGGPPMWGIMKKIRNKYATSDERITFIRDYAMQPSEAKMLFPAATREYFGVMPSMRDKVSDAEMQRIAKYLDGYQAVK